MSTITIAEDTVLRRAMIEIASLPNEDLVVLLDVMATLKKQRVAAEAEEILQAAFKRADLLRDVPRAELAAQFNTIREQIRTEAIEQGTVIDGDWD